MTCVKRYRAILTIIYIFLAPVKRSVIVESRAIMVEPPHRSSLWRFNYNTSVNLRDDSLNCGGYDWQWGVHGGRCGVCGDLWNGTQHNADQGQYDSGIIVRRYIDGHYINITFEVSSNYLGYVEFRLCPRNTTDVVLEQSCFDRYPLWIDESHGTRYYIGSRGGIYDIHIRLPGGLICKKCVLQWKYKTGYRYNGDETCKCLGCGRQEQYVNCADIEITPTEGWPLEHSIQGSGRQPSHRQQHMVQQTIGQPSHRHQHMVQQTIGQPSHRQQHMVQQTIKPTRVSQPSEIATIIQIETDKSLKRSSTSIHLMSASTYLTSSMKKEIMSEFPKLKTSTLRITATSVRALPTSLEFSPSIQMASTSISPSFSSFITSSSVSATALVRQQAVTLDVIRREIVKKLGSEVQNGMKIFFSPPKEIGQTVRPATSRPRVSRFPASPKRPEVPNTQFVSVSNILDRFYPNYITPLLLSLAQPSTTALKPSTGCDVNSDEFRCKARGIYQQSPGISKWCEINCRASNCVTFMCECSCEDKTISQNTSCHAIADFHGVEGMDQWCRANCKVGYCPANTCSVEDCINKPLHGEV